MARSWNRPAEGLTDAELTRAERREDEAFRARRHMRARAKYPRSTRPMPSAKRRYHGGPVRLRHRTVTVPRLGWRAKGMIKLTVHELTRGGEVIGSEAMGRIKGSRYGHGLTRWYDYLHPMNSKQRAVLEKRARRGDRGEVY